MIDGSKVSKWFRQHGRQLPWRETENPYYILVSEIMLQQTQVVTVIPYYHRFIKRLPTLNDLAQASDELLHELWEGLGYYSRVHRLRQFALDVLEKYDGTIPSDKETLLSLPGIGPYTVGALLSFAFKQKEPAIDGNVYRVMARLYNDSGDITKAATKRRFYDYVFQMMDQDVYGFNQGLIELGALRCTPKNPKCESCPLVEECKAYKKGTVLELPVKPSKKKQKVRKVPMFILIEDEDMLFIQRGPKGLLSNMYGFPMIEEGLALSMDDFMGSDVYTKFSEYFQATFQVSIDDGWRFVGCGKHVFSHVIWEEYVYILETEGLKACFEELQRSCEGRYPEYKWAKPYDISIPTAFKRALDVYAKNRLAIDEV